ncbi:MAG: autotransporter outer membrane beta-barrel domain-containing protein [Nitrospira sp.]|nr:autotransporter outer membrane beta-barrel domain-containing protein [Nitrospira sp.]
MKNIWSIGTHLSPALVLLVTVFLSSQVPAQVLDQKVESLLKFSLPNGACPGLHLPPEDSNPAEVSLAGLGPNLRAICKDQRTDGIGAQFGTSTGGGAASFQGSAASILNTALQKRMEELKAEKKNEGEKSQKPTSMLFNPLGLLGAASLGNLSIASPLYATLANSGGSSATFATSSPSRWNGLGFFGSGQVQALDRNVGSFTDGYRSTIYGLTVGADYRFTDQLVAGLMGNYAYSGGSFTGGGTFSTNSYGGLVFASIQPTEKTFIQVTAGYARNNYLVTRQATANITKVVLENPQPCTNGLAVDCSVHGPASSNSNGDVVNGGIFAGYDLPLGRFTVGPRVGVNYTHTHISSFTENGSTGLELRYDPQNIHSLQSVIGAQGFAAFRTAVGLLVPQVHADYIHEFANSQRLITVQFTEDLRGTPTRFTFQNDVPVRNYFNLGTGLLAVLPNGWQTFVSFRAMVGNSQFNNYAGTVGLRIAL